MTQNRAIMSRVAVHLLSITLFLQIITLAFASNSQWSCALLDSSDVSGDGAIEWQRLNCTGTTPDGNSGPLVFNVLKGNLSSNRVSIRPSLASATASTSKAGLQTLSDMADSMYEEYLPSSAIVAGGINGGYFFRTDIDKFIDDVCWLKTYDDAEKPVEEGHPNYGLSDGLVVIDGELKGSNCDCLGYSRPATLIINQTHSHIVIQHRGDSAPEGTLNALAAGPNLVSEDSETGLPFVDIPWDDHNVNLLGHGSNSAIGMIRGTLTAQEGFEQIVFCTVDGHGGCSKEKEESCGINSKKLAYFMKDELGCSVSMEMDQGGSTTLLVNGQGIVSNPGSGARHIANGLFLVLDA